MTRREFLPRADTALLAYTDNFGRLINAAPGDYGLVPAVATDYVATQATFGRAAADVARPGDAGASGRSS